MTAVFLTSPRPTADPPCRANPDRWFYSGPNPELRAHCRRCPRRWVCAREATELPGIQGMESGVYLPKDGRGRETALRKLRTLAEYGSQLPAVG